MDNERIEQVDKLIKELEITKLTVTNPPLKTEDGSVTETTKRSTQISPCVFGELLQELEDALNNGYEIDIKVNCKEPK